MTNLTAAQEYTVAVIWANAFEQARQSEDFNFVLNEQYKVAAEKAVKAARKIQKTYARKGEKFPLVRLNRNPFTPWMYN